MTNLICNLIKCSQQLIIASLLILITTLTVSSKAHAVYFGFENNTVNVEQHFKAQRSTCWFLGLTGCTTVDAMHESANLLSIRFYLGHDFYQNDSSRTGIEFGYYVPINHSRQRYTPILGKIFEDLEATRYNLNMMDLMIVHHQNLLKDTNILSAFGKAGLQRTHISSNSRFIQNNQISIDSVTGIAPLLGIGIEVKPWKHFSIDLSLDKRLRKLKKNTDKTSIKHDSNLNLGFGITFHF